jgi:hypothetical protein
VCAGRRGCCEYLMGDALSPGAGPRLIKPAQEFISCDGTVLPVALVFECFSVRTCSGKGY